MKQTLDQVELHYFKTVVKNGGGEYVGIQEGLTFDLVLFNSPKTGTTLALKTTDPIDSDVVAARIRESNKKWGIIG